MKEGMEWAWPCFDQDPPPLCSFPISEFRLQFLADREVLKTGASSSAIGSHGTDSFPVFPPDRQGAGCSSITEVPSREYRARKPKVQSRCCICHSAPKGPGSLLGALDRFLPLGLEASVAPETPDGPCRPFCLGWAGEIARPDYSALSYCWVLAALRFVPRCPQPGHLVVVFLGSRLSVEQACALPSPATLGRTPRFAKQK